MVEAKVQREASGLVDYVELIIDKIKQKYSEAICLMNDEVYGDQDVDIEIYVPEEKLLEVERFAHEVALRAGLSQSSSLTTDSRKGLSRTGRKEVKGVWDVAEVEQVQQADHPIPQRSHDFG
jgi:hypothetical protein